MDLEGLLRIPWNIEVKVTSQSTFSPSSSSAYSTGVNRASFSSLAGPGGYWPESPGGPGLVVSTGVPTTSEYLKVDCFLGKKMLFVRKKEFYDNISPSN